MTELKLNSTEIYKKYNAVKKAGYEIITENKNVRLIDKQNPNADKYVDLIFKNIDEALIVLAGTLLKFRIVVTV